MMTYLQNIDPTYLHFTWYSTRRNLAHAGLFQLHLVQQYIFNFMSGACGRFAHAANTG